MTIFNAQPEPPEELPLPSTANAFTVLRRLNAIFPPNHPVWLALLGLPTLLTLYWLGNVMATEWTWDDEGVAFLGTSAVFVVSLFVYFRYVGRARRRSRWATIERLFDALEQFTDIFPAHHPLWLILLGLPTLATLYWLGNQVADNWTWDDEGVAFGSVATVLATTLGAYFRFVRVGKGAV